MDHQRANVDTALDTKTESFMEDSKPKRTRIVPEKKVPIQKAVKNTLFETEEIVAKITQLDDVHLYEKLRSRGLEQSAKFSWKNTMEQYIEFFKKLYNEN